MDLLVRAFCLRCFTVTATTIATLAVFEWLEQGHTCFWKYIRGKFEMDATAAWNSCFEIYLLESRCFDGLMHLRKSEE